MTPQQPSPYPKREPKKIYLATAKPEDFMDIQILDWIQYVGDVTTEYEVNFLRNFGGFICASHSAIQQEPGQQEQNILAELEETIDNWWRTYNDLDYDAYRRIPDKRGKNRFKHHHNMRTHIYKKYKMFFDCCKSPEGIQRMRDFNKKVKEHLERQDQRNPVKPMETLI